MSDRLDSIRARAEKATPGPWQWAGNVDYTEPFLGSWLPGSGLTTVMGHIPVERTENDCRLDGIEDVIDAANRAEVVHDFLYDSNDERRTDQKLAFRDEHLMMKPASGMARYQVAPTATSRHDQSVYRADINGIRHPDAEFIAHSRDDVTWLISEVERLRALQGGDSNGAEKE